MLVLMALLAVALVAPPAFAQSRIALVIGNANYAHAGVLRNPVNDATDVARSLQSLGFAVTLRTNLTQREFNRALTAFGEQVRPGTVALFFYAGHGIQSRGQNFLIPVDAQIRQESAVRSETVNVDQVFDQLQTASVGLVILDACRNNPFERSFRSGAGSGLAQLDAPRGTLIAFSTAPGRVAEDGTGTRNSPYTAALVKALGQPERPVETVFKEVRREVGEATANRQLPWETSSLIGEFYFRTPATAAAALGSPPQAAPAAAAGSATRDADLTVELAFWDAIKNSTQATDYEAYLAQYPDGRFAVLARARLRTLGASGAPASVAAATAPVPSAPVPSAAVPATTATPQAPQAAAAAPGIGGASTAPGAAGGSPATAAGGAGGFEARRVVYRIEDVHWRQRREVVLEVTARSADRTEFAGGRRVEAPAGRTRGPVDAALRLGLLDAYQPPAGWVPEVLTPGHRIASVRYPVDGRCELQLAGRVLAAVPVALPAAGAGGAPSRVDGVPIEYTGWMTCAVMTSGVSAGNTFFAVRFVVTHAPALGRIVGADLDGTAAASAQLRFREVLSLLSAD